MTLIISAILFMLGSAIGSFISVITHRLPKNQKGIFFGRSICPSCKKKIKFRHLIPVFSWLFLRGRCANCGKKISPHYLAVEITTGTMFLLSYLKWNFLTGTAPFQAIDFHLLSELTSYLVIITLLSTIFFYDLLHQEIPDNFSLPALAIAIATGLLFKTPTPMEMAIGAGLIGSFFALQYIVSRGHWIGSGDIRLGLIMGAILGWKLGLMALALAYLSGAAVSIALLLGKKIKRKSHIAFGPFLVTATFLCMLYGETILSWYLNKIMF